MKIAFFTNTILEHGGGLEKYFIDVSSELAKRYPDDEISVITFNERRTEALQRVLSLYYAKEMPISNIYREKTEDILRKLGRARYIKCASFRELKKELSRHDVVYSKNEIIDLSILKWFGYGSLPPVIVGAHTPVRILHPISGHDRLHNFLYMGFLYKFLLEGTKAAHVLNADDQRLFRERLFSKSKSIHKILLPFHVSEKEIGRLSSHDELNVLFVGRLTALKGLDVLFSCIRILGRTDEFGSIKFRIAGSGESDLTRDARALSEEYSNVEYQGHVPHDEMDSLYRWSDIVIIPSRHETANYVVLEATEFARVVVASDIPGPREAIRNGKTGFLLPVDAKSFAETILFLLKTKKERPKDLIDMGNAAREYVRGKFDPDNVYGQFRSMLEDSGRVTGVFGPNKK